MLIRRTVPRRPWCFPVAGRKTLPVQRGKQNALIHHFSFSTTMTPICSLISFIEGRKWGVHRDPGWVTHNSRQQNRPSINCTGGERLQESQISDNPRNILFLFGIVVGSKWWEIQPHTLETNSWITQNVSSHSRLHIHTYIHMYKEAGWVLIQRATGLH